MSNEPPADVPMTTATMPTEKFGRMIEIQAAATRYVNAVIAFQAAYVLSEKMREECLEADRQLRQIVTGETEEPEEETADANAT